MKLSSLETLMRFEYFKSIMSARGDEEENKLEISLNICLSNHLPERLSEANWEIFTIINLILRNFFTSSSTENVSLLKASP